MKQKVSKPRIGKFRKGMELFVSCWAPWSVIFPCLCCDHGRSCDFQAKGRSRKRRHQHVGSVRFTSMDLNLVVSKRIHQDSRYDHAPLSHHRLRHHDTHKFSLPMRPNELNDIQMYCDFNMFIATPTTTPPGCLTTNFLASFMACKPFVPLGGSSDLGRGP